MNANTTATAPVIRPEFDRDTREQKADMLDRMVAITLFMPKPEPVYVPRHAAK